MTELQTQIINLCALAKIVACNDDVTREEKVALVKLADRVERIVIREINQSENPSSTWAATVDDKALVKFATNFRRGVLEGRRSDLMCFVVCAPLQGFLKAVCGLNTELVEGDIKFDEGECNHVWLRLPDGRILDPTIDQFKMFMGKKLPKVYLGQPMPILHCPRKAA